MAVRKKKLQKIEKWKGPPYGCTEEAKKQPKKKKSKKEKTEKFR